MVDLYGERGQAWLEAFPSLLETCARRWSLTLFPPFDLTYNYVAPAQRDDDSEVVLKLGVPNPELDSEIEALRIYDGRGIARLLDSDKELGALLLERLRPGTMLVTVEDDEAATEIAAVVMQKLWRPLPNDHNFPTVEKWARGMERLRRTFDGGSGPIPEELVAMAEALFKELLPSSAPPVLLHGDLHHYNILAAQREPWLALDPKGVAGEPAYEPGALLRNPMPKIGQMLELSNLLLRRIDQLSEILQLDKQRLTGWGMAQAVLSAWWSYEESASGWEAAMTVAQALAPHV
jgi:streptomycin 6-kinase